MGSMAAKTAVAVEELTAAARPAVIQLAVGFAHAALSMSTPCSDESPGICLGLLLVIYRIRAEEVACRGFRLVNSS